MFKLLGPLFFLSFSLLAQDRHCFSPSVREIKAPIDYSKDGGTFTYRYSLSEREDPEAPVVIFIPGGPGQTSMDMPLAYPYEFAVVRTDPRGMGCNQSDMLPKESFSTENIARDLLAVVRDLKGRKYFIHGISYGTMVATVLTSLIEKEGLPLPELVVLEGTIGRVYAPDEYLKSTLKRWREVKAGLPLSVQKVLNEHVPFSFTSKEFAAWVSAILIYGTLPAGMDYAHDELILLDPDADSDLREGLQLRMKKITAPPTVEKVKHYKEIACREFVPDVRDVKYDYDFVKGELVPVNTRLCQGMGLDRPYDSKKYQLKSKIIYFYGDQDPVTPKEQLAYHFNHQRSTRTLITVHGGGHTALSTNLSDCFSALWVSFLHKTEIPLKDCALKTTIKNAK